MRLDELAGVLVGGAGEGALLVAEQDALDEIVGDGAAIDGDEGLGPARRRRPGWRAPPVPCRRPTRPRSGSGCSRPPPSAPSRMTRSMAGLRGDDVLEARPRRRALRAAPLPRPRSASTLSALAMATSQPFGRGRLDHEIEGAGAHRRDHGVDAALRGLHDDRHGRCRARASPAARRARRGPASPGRGSRREIAGAAALRAASSAASPPSATTAVVAEARHRRLRAGAAGRDRHRR